MITDNKLNASLELRNLIMVWNITLFYFILPPLSIIWAQALCFQEILVIENVYVSASTCISCVVFFFWYFPSLCLALFRLSLLKIDFSLIQFILITISAPFIPPSSPATSPLLHSHLPLFSLQKTEVLQEETSKYDRSRNNKIRQIQARILKLD